MARPFATAFVFKRRLDQQPPPFTHLPLLASHWPALFPLESMQQHTPSYFRFASAVVHHADGTQLAACAAVGATMEATAGRAIAAALPIFLMSSRRLYVGFFGDPDSASSRRADRKRSSAS